jgi:ribosomal protein S18 acetylase RimI-like enzyme
VRRAIAADVPKMVELWRAMWEVHERADPRFASTPYAEPFMRRWLEDNLSNRDAVVLVAEMGGRVEGYALGFIVRNPPVVPWEFYGHVSEVAVAPERRGQGIGRALVRALHEAFRARGCAYAEAYVAVTNPQAQAFWRRVGYGPFIERLRCELSGAPGANAGGKRSASVT